MKRMFAIVLAMVMLLTGCGGTSQTREVAYQQISQEAAKELMDARDVIVLDVREQHEYDSGHIPGAVLLPVGTITGDTAAAVIDDLDTVILVYCRSGNRSKTASQALVDLGYTNVYEFGGMNTWPYDIE